MIQVCRVYLHAFKDESGNFFLKNKPKSYGHTCFLNSRIVRTRRRPSNQRPAVTASSPSDQMRGVIANPPPNTRVLSPFSNTMPVL